MLGWAGLAGNKLDGISERERMGCMNEEGWMDGKG